MAAGCWTLVAGGGTWWPWPWPWTLAPGAGGASRECVGVGSLECRACLLLAPRECVGVGSLLLAPRGFRAPGRRRRRTSEQQPQQLTATQGAPAPARRAIYYLQRFHITLPMSPPPASPCPWFVVGLSVLWLLVLWLSVL
jgi:hypothetical protein